MLLQRQTFRMELNKLPINLIPIASERVFIRWPGEMNNSFGMEEKEVEKKIIEMNKKILNKNILNKLKKERKMC